MTRTGGVKLQQPGTGSEVPAPFRSGKFAPSPTIRTSLPLPERFLRCPMRSTREQERDAEKTVTGSPLNQFPHNFSQRFPREILIGR